MKARVRLSGGSCRTLQLPDVQDNAGKMWLGMDIQDEPDSGG